MPKSPTRITAARALYMLDRAMRERLLDRTFGTEQLLRAAEYFQQTGVEGCIYCGDGHVERWDHLVSVRAGGGTVLGNMVPACQKCDDSKGSRDYRDWLAASARFNPARENPALREAIIKRIQDYQQHFAFSPPADFLSILTDDQSTQYSAFSRALATFRGQLVEFGLVPQVTTEEEIEDDDDA